MVPLKYLSKFRRTLEMQLINSEINLILTWSGNYVLSIKQQGLQQLAENFMFQL